MRIIAHRGVSSLAPENTMAAFVKCLEVGVDWFEFDLRMLADNSLIVAHDDRADRTTSGTGLFSEMEFGDLRRLDAGKWFSSAHRLERVPELATVIELLNSTQLHANIELKFSVGDTEVRRTFVETTVQNLQALQDPTKLLVSAFSTDLLKHFTELSPHIPTAYLVDAEDDLEAALEVGRQLGCQALNPFDEGLTEADVQLMGREGFATYVWTVNDVDRAKQLQDWGIDGIFTDVPQDMIAAGLQS